MPTRSWFRKHAHETKDFSRWVIAALVGDVLYLALTNNPAASALWVTSHVYWYAYAASVLVLSWVLVFTLRKFWALGHRSLSRVRCEATLYFRFFAVLFVISQAGLIGASELGAPRILAQAFFMLVPPLFFKKYAQKHIFGKGSPCQ